MVNGELKRSALYEEPKTLNDLKRFCKKKFPAWYSPTIYVVGELFYWQQEVAQSFKCRGANNCGTSGLLKKYYFLFFL